MKKIIIIFIFFTLLLPTIGHMESQINRPSSATIVRDGNTATLTWKNPRTTSFFKIILFRSTIPIEDFYTYEAVAGICDRIYEGQDESFHDTGLAINLPYYYILFARDKTGSTSKAVVLNIETEKKENNNSLAGASSTIVNEVSSNEAGMIYNYNKPVDIEFENNTKRLALFIIVKTPQYLSQKDKNSISYFIQSGTPTTILLGSGERAGVLNSYLSVFNKLPRNVLEWQDIIKIANGRWPDERNLTSEDKAANTFFSTIYERKPDMNNPNDSAAVTVIAYGLRPAARNLESEKKAIEIFRSIFDKSPIEATDWDLVRAIAYSGATR
jgi:hypothetical protein